MSDYEVDAAAFTASIFAGAFNRESINKESKHKKMNDREKAEDLIARLRVAKDARASAHEELLTAKLAEANLRATTYIEQKDLLEKMGKKPTEAAVANAVDTAQVIMSIGLEVIKKTHAYEKDRANEEILELEIKLLTTFVAADK